MPEPTNPKQAVVGSAALPAATLYDVYATADRSLLALLLGDAFEQRLAPLTASGPAIGERRWVKFTKLSPEGAAGFVRAERRYANGASDTEVAFVVEAERVEPVLERVRFIDAPPEWPAAQVTPPAAQSITPAQARAQGTGVGAFFRAYQWPILGVGVIGVLGAAWLFTRKK